MTHASLLEANKRATNPRRFGVMVRNIAGLRGYSYDYDIVH